MKSRYFVTDFLVISHFLNCISFVISWGNGLGGGGGKKFFGCGLFKNWGDWRKKQKSIFVLKIS